MTNITPLLNFLTVKIGRQFIKIHFLVTHPDPEPPTIAIFFPAGILNDKFCKIGFPSSY